MTLEEYEYIVHRIRPKLKKIAYRFFQNSEDAEDVVQGVATKMDCIHMMKDQLRVMAQQMVDLAKTTRE